MGRGRQDRLHRRVERAAGRRPRAGSRATTRRRTRLSRGGLRGRGRHADRRHRGRGRHLPDRPGERDLARERRRRLHARSSRTTASTSQKYRAVVAGDVIHQKLEDKVVADATKPGPQRDVSEIWIQAAAADLPADSHQGPAHPVLAQGRPVGGIERRHPRHRPVVGGRRGRGPSGLRRSSRPIRDLFDSIARAESDETSARGATGTGGKLPVLRLQQTQRRRGVPRRDHEAGSRRRLAPRAGQVGLRLARHPGDVPADRRRAHRRAQDEGRRRRRLRRARPRQLRGAVGRRRAATSAGSRRASSTTALTAAIFATPIGKTSEVVTIADDDTTKDGVYLFKVAAEETRTPEGRQLEQLKSSAFSTGTRSRRRLPPSSATSRSRAQQPARRRTPCSTRSSPRRDCAGGSIPRPGVQVVAAERHRRDPDRAVAPAPDRAARRAPARGRRRRSRPPVEPLPGRHGPGGADPHGLLARLYPAEHAVGRFGAAETTTIAALAGTDLASGPLYVGRWRRRPRSPGRGRCPGSAPGCASPTAALGPRADPPERCAATCSRRPTRSTTRSRRAPRPSSRSELGDLLLQVVLHAQLAAEAGVFDLTDVEAALATKIVRRHPHVFGDAEARTAMDVNRQWERIKATERADAGETAATKSALDGISPSLPALAASQEMQERAAHLGYDWPSIDGVLDKVVEETDELRAAEAAGDDTGLGGGVRRPPVRPRQRRAQARRRRRGGDARGERQVPAPVRSRRTRGRRSGGRPSRPGLPGPRCPVGCRQGGGASHDMTIGNRPATVRADGRGPRDLRPISFTLGVQKWAEGSCRVQMGDTEVLCAATIADRVPPHLRGKGTGWVTAEYSMLPRATAERTDRESAKGRIGGRTHEIQRLIGRSLRGVVDLTKLGERTITDRLRRPPGRRRHADRLDHRRLRRARGGAHHVRDGPPPRQQGRRGVGRHRRRRPAPRPRLLGGLARGRRLQRRRHRRGRVRRAAGHRRGQAVRPGRRERADRSRRRRARRGCSRPRPRSSPPSGGDRAAAPRSSRRAPRTSCASCASSSTSTAASWSRSTTWGSRATPSRTARPSPTNAVAQGPLRGPGDRAADARRRLRDRGRRPRRRSGRADAAVRRGARDRRGEQRASCWPRWPACRRSVAARATCASSRSRCPSAAGPRGGPAAASSPAAPAAAGSRPRRAGRAGSATTRSSSRRPSRPAVAPWGCGPRPRSTRSRTAPRAARRMTPHLRDLGF